MREGGKVEVGALIFELSAFLVTPEKFTSDGLRDQTSTAAQS